jgi:hypothetical protein
VTNAGETSAQRVTQLMDLDDPLRESVSEGWYRYRVMRTVGA